MWLTIKEGTTPTVSEDAKTLAFEITCKSIQFIPIQLRGSPTDARRVSSVEVNSHSF